MAQHDMNIANQGFPATRADLNNALQAIATNNSGTSEPSTTFANQWFYNTTTNKLFIRNEANNAFIEVATLDQTNNEWQITTGVIQAKDSDGLALKTDDGTTRLFIQDSDGAVGIGRSSGLSHLLDIQKATNAFIRISNGTTQAASGIIFANQNTTKFTLEKSGSAHSLFLKDASSNNVATFKQSAHVGIGTDNPNPTKLAILAGGSAQGVLLARNASGAGSPTSGQNLGSFGFKGGMDGVNSLGAAEARITAQAAENHSGSAAGTHLDFYCKQQGVGPGSAPLLHSRMTSKGTLQTISLGLGDRGSDTPNLTITKVTSATTLNFDFIHDADASSWTPVGYNVYVTSVHSGLQRQRNAGFFIRGAIFNGSLQSSQAHSFGDTSDVSVAVSDQGGTDPITIRVGVTSPNNRTVATVQAHGYMGIQSVS